MSMRWRSHVLHDSLVMASFARASLERISVVVTLCAWILCSAPALAQTPKHQSLAEWVTQLGSKDHRPRQEAYRELMREPSPRIIPLLGEQIESFAASSQTMACNLLRRLPFAQTRDLYKRLLDAKDPYLRAASAARCWQEAGSKVADRKRPLRVLLGALAECPDGRKMSMVHATSQVVDEAVFVELRKWLQPKKATHIVTGVLRELLRRERGVSVATSTAVKLLLASEEPRVLGAAHAYLLREDEAHEKRLAELSRKEPAVFWTVRDLLPTDGKHSDAIVSVIVAALLAPRSDRDVNQLAQMLKKHSAAPLGKALRELIGHDKDDIRTAALKQLSTLNGGLQAGDLKELLRSKAVIARLIAADTMRRRDDKSGLEIVLAAVPDAKKHKAEAARVLGRFRSRQAMPVLLDLLDDADEQARVAAWQGVQETMRSLFPYRNFAFDKAGYEPRASSRAAGIQVMRAWWGGAK